MKNLNFSLNTFGLHSVYINLQQVQKNVIIQHLIVSSVIKKTGTDTEGCWLLLEIIAITNRISKTNQLKLISLRVQCYFICKSTKN